MGKGTNQNCEKQGWNKERTKWDVGDFSLQSFSNSASQADS